MTTRFETTAVRYIKLGSAGTWAKEALGRGIVPFGYPAIPHQMCKNGNWEAVREKLIETGSTNNGASQALREICDFYELDDTVLWITFTDGHLWWAFADSEVNVLTGGGTDAPTRFRNTRDGWQKENLRGEELWMNDLSSALTKVASYQMTICKVEHEEYLLRKIRGEEEPLYLDARKTLDIVKHQALQMIKNLHWREFETLVDLILSRNGWHRTSILGGNMPDADIIVEQPLTGEKAWVQIKSSSGQIELDDYLDRFRRDGSCRRFIFACHSPRGDISTPNDEYLVLWTGEELARLATQSGLLEWLLKRTR